MPYVSVNYADTIKLLEHLGDIVGREREERGLGLPTAAEEIGIPMTLLWAIEQGDAVDLLVASTVVKLLRWLERG